MRTRCLCIALLLLAGRGVAAQSGQIVLPIEEPAQDAGHIMDEPTLPVVSGEDHIPPSPYEGSLQEAISADLIDLSALKATLERPLAGPVLRLTLDEAIQIALVNNPDIIIAEYEPEKATADIYAARGEFDPVLQQQITYTDSTTALDQRLRSFLGISPSMLGYGTGASSSPDTLVGQVFLLTELVSGLGQQLRGAGLISSIDARGYTAETVLGGKLQHGTQYAMSFDLGYEESTFDQFRGEYSGRLGLMLTQPILRGFGRHLNTIRIRAARNLRDISEAQARLTVLNRIAEVVNAYWDVVGATEAVRVYEDALRNAERLLAINETRRRIGAAADIDVLQAKAGVAMRQSELIAAYARVADAGDMLKLIMHLQEGDLFSKAFIVPLDRPNPDSSAVFDVELFDESLDAGVQRALELRPEMDMSDLELANAALEEERARNDMLPQLDIMGSYTRGGRDRGFSRTMTGLREEQDRIYMVGIQSSIAINNRAARGAHQRARLNKRQAEERRKQTEMALMMAVHYAARAVHTNRALLESNRQTVRLQEANVAAEEKRLRLGVTTSYQVLRMQEDLTAAQTQALQAQIAFEKALVEFQKADGSLLENLGIQYSINIEDRPVSWLQSVGISSN